MYRTLILASFAAAAFAQDPADLFNRAPADVDQALRARITEFYHYHVSEEYRKAEALVAEDTKDYFYMNNKPHYNSFEIGKIDYTDGFTKAKALVTVRMAVMLPGFNGQVMAIPTASYWELIDGKWYWYLSKANQHASPMGEMHPGPPAPDTGAPAMPAIPSNFNELFSQVKVDKAEVAIKPGASDQVVISNSMTGPIDLTVEGNLDGIQAAFDHPEVKPGEKATMTIKTTDGAKAGVLTVKVRQTGQKIPIQVILK